MLNDEQNLGYYVKHVLFKHRSNPQGSHRALHTETHKGGIEVGQSQSARFQAHGRAHNAR